MYCRPCRDGSADVLLKRTGQYEDKGKSGSAGVCYVDFAAFEKNYLLQVFSKDEKSNLTAAEKNEVKQVIEVLKTETAKNWRKEHE